MAKKPYDWEAGAILGPHSVAKLRVLKDYLYDYICTRCAVPHARKFRLIVIDAFAGGGRYRCGTEGSPLIFFENLRRAEREINLDRAGKGLAQVHIEALMLFNDANPAAIETLKQNLAPYEAEAKENARNLSVKIEYSTLAFAEAFSVFEAKVKASPTQNVLVNLDQYGHGEVRRDQLSRILGWANSVEIFFTFAVETLLSFLDKNDPAALQRQLRHMQLSVSDFATLRQQPTSKLWLGAAERVVFDALQSCALFVSPFSINNPQGWMYWLMHFAKSYRARQVYNNVLHRHAAAQAHFGRSGLEMLAYNPETQGQLYLFNEEARVRAFEALCDDIPRLVAKEGNEMQVSQFYGTAYKATPAHADEIHKAMIESPDIEIITDEGGGERRTPHTIRPTDMIRVRRQTYLFSHQQLSGRKKV